MTHAEYFKQLDEILNRAPGSTKPGESLQDLEGWDSLAMLGLIALADSELSLRLTGKQIKDARTTDDLVAMVAEKLS